MTNTLHQILGINGSFTRGYWLRTKMRESHLKIRNNIAAINSQVGPRTQAHNRKCGFQSPGEEQEFRADVMSAQIKSWRSMLPKLIKKFSRIPDYRNPKSIKHKITVLLMFGLLAFIFCLQINRHHFLGAPFSICAPNSVPLQIVDIWRLWSRFLLLPLRQL